MEMPGRNLVDTATHRPTITATMIVPLHNAVTQSWAAGGAPGVSAFGGGAIGSGIAPSSTTFNSPLGGYMLYPITPVVPYYSQSITLNVVAPPSPLGFRVSVVQGSSLASVNITGAGAYTLNYTPGPSSAGTVYLKIERTAAAPGIIKMTGVIKDSITFVNQSVVANISSDDGYHYGYNGQIKDNEWAGKGNHLDYKFRGFDPRTGRFNSADPLVKSFPWNSSYAFAENRVIDCIELEGAEALSIHIRSFISAKSVFDPLNRKFDGDNRKATVREDVTARGRARIDYDFPTNKAKIAVKSADKTYRYGSDGEILESRGTVNGALFQMDIKNGKNIGIHYETKNPLTPAWFTPTVDVDAGYSIRYNKNENAWDLSFSGKSDGYPSTETFIEDPCGNRIMLGFMYEKNSPGKELWGAADTEVFNGHVKINLDENYNFKSATSGTMTLPIVPPSPAPPPPTSVK